MNIVTNSQHRIKDRFDSLIRKAKTKEEYDLISEFIRDSYQEGLINTGQFENLRQSLLIQKSILEI